MNDLIHNPKGEKPGEGSGDKFVSWEMFRRFLERVGYFFLMLKYLLCRKYRSFPWYLLFSLAFAVLYVVNPFDLFPDFIPLIGQIDDMAVLVICLKIIGIDVEKFRKWYSFLEK